MSQGRRRRKQDAYAAYRRPEAQAQDEVQWDAPADGWQDTAAWSGSAVPEDEPSWDAETVWDDEPVQPQYDNDTYYAQEDTRQVVATNRAVRLSCTLAAVSGLFGLFLCFAERESRAIRLFALGSTALSAMDLLCAAVLALVGFSLGSIPLMGFVITLMCWLIYIGVLVVLAVIRVRMMLFAWRGLYFRLPGIGMWLENKFM